MQLKQPFLRRADENRMEVVPVAHPLVPIVSVSIPDFADLVVQRRENSPVATSAPSPWSLSAKSSALAKTCLRPACTVNPFAINRRPIAGFRQFIESEPTCSIKEGRDQSGMEIARVLGEFVAPLRVNFNGAFLR